MHSNLFRNNYHLDPAPEGAAGGAASAGSPAGGESAPAFDASQYVPKAEFEAIQNDYQSFRQTAEQRFQDYDSRLPKPAKVEDAPKLAPKHSDYDFNKEGELERFLDDRASFLMEQKFSERDTKQSETQRQEGYKQYVQSTQDAHAERADSFRAANPDYDPNKSVLLGNDTVALAVLESDYSAHIHNYLQKNPGKVSEIRKMTPAAAVRAIGRIEAKFETQETAVPQKQKAASTQTTVGGFPSKVSGGKVESDQEIYDKWHK